MDNSSYGFVRLPKIGHSLAILSFSAYHGNLNLSFAACRCGWCNYSLELSIGYDHSKGVLDLGLLHCD